MLYEDKESKEMMKILSENKKKGQLKNKQLAATKEHAKDILTSVWMIVGFFIVIELISWLA